MSLRLNLGSGNRPMKGFINIDIQERVKPDLICDLSKGIPFEDNTVDEVRAYDFLEHIPLGKTVGVIEEIWRVLKPGGIFDSFTPDAEYGQGGFQDPTHVSFWVENSWLYFSNSAYRELYGIKANFRIEYLKRVNDDSAGRVFHLHVLAVAVKGIKPSLFGKEN